jgi:hypothetical protein
VIVEISRSEVLATVVPGSVVRAGQLDCSEAFGDRLEPGHSVELFGLRFRRGRGTEERRVAVRVQEAQGVVPLRQVRANGDRGHHSPLEGAAGDHLVAVHGRIAPET